jgi:uncharacterized membrane protein YkvA (DUF1232 family)
MVRFTAILIRVPRYVRLAYRLTRDSRLTAGQRALAAVGAAYLISPIDAIPGVIPVAGQLDDLAVLLLGIRQALRSCPADVAAEHLDRSGVTLTTIDADLATVRATAVWLALKTGSLVAGVASGLARVAQRRTTEALGQLSGGLRRTVNRGRLNRGSD